MSDNPVVEDFVDATPTTSEPLATEPPSSVDQLLEEGKSPLADNSPARATKTAAELAAANAKLDRDARLARIREDKSIVRHAAAFLRDMSGHERMSITYRICAWFEIELRVMSGEQLEEITRQNFRDLVTGRIRYLSEASEINYYRIAASLKRAVMTDPQSGEVSSLYDADGSQADIDAFTSDGVLPTDYPIRRRSKYLLSTVFKSSTIYGLALGKISEFESLLSDLSFLSVEDADFFLKCLTEESC